jgi:hypothetical protein
MISTPKHLSFSRQSKLQASKAEVANKKCLSGSKSVSNYPPIMLQHVPGAVRQRSGKLARDGGCWPTQNVSISP